MKKAAFILGLIAGILGIISCAMLLFIALNMQVINPNANDVLIFGIIGAIASIVGLVGACIKNKIGGILMLGAAIFSFLTAFWGGIGGDSPLNFILQIIIAILFLIAGIFALIAKN